MKGNNGTLLTNNNSLEHGGGYEVALLHVLTNVAAIIVIRDAAKPNSVAA